MTAAAARARRTPPRGGKAAGPLRRCVATGATLPRAALVRCAVDPAGMIVPDVGERLPGRGLWITARRDIVSGAAAARGFARAARRAVRLEDARGTVLADAIERRLVQRCIDLLGLARRAGQAVCGHERVRERLQAGHCGPCAVLLTAADGAGDGIARLARLSAHAAPQAVRVALLDAGELGQAFGRERVVHAAMNRGRLAAELARQAARLGGFRMPPAPRMDDQG